MTLEQHLRERREALKISQTGLAKMLGFDSPQFVSNCDRGLCGWPVKHFHVLSKILKVSIKDMARMRTDDFSAELLSELARLSRIKPCRK